MDVGFASEDLDVEDDEKSEGGEAEDERVREVLDRLLFVVADPERGNDDCEDAEPEEGVDEEEHNYCFCFLLRRFMFYD